MKRLETKNGTPISRLGFGAMQFGSTADERSAREMLEACIEAGINLFDTAFSYTGGESERILGKLVAPMADDILIATKAPNDRPSSSDNLRASYEESRKRLGIDSIDIYYLHRFDSETELEETFGTLADMQSQGMIHHIGVSNFAAWQIMKAQAVCAGFGTQVDVC